MTYSTLQADCVIDTIHKLQLRIGERFPGAGLNGVADALARMAQDCAAEADKMAQPNRPIRAGVYAIWVVGAAALAWLAASLRFDPDDLDAAGLVPFLESAMNLAVLMGIGVISLARLEERYKRRRALAYLHELRSIAHVIDMHQLTKDPYRHDLPDTAHSPKRVIKGALLERYLDYCSELLSLTGKLAALFAQSSRDAEVAAAASDVEQLANGLARNIWQKIMALPSEENSIR